MIVTVLHLNHHLHKVPLHWDLLVTHLRRSKEMFECLILEVYFVCYVLFKKIN